MAIWGISSSVVWGRGKLCIFVIVIIKEFDEVLLIQTLCLNGHVITAARAMSLSVRFVTFFFLFIHSLHDWRTCAEASSTAIRTSVLRQRHRSVLVALTFRAKHSSTAKEVGIVAIIIVRTFRALRDA